MEIGAIGSVAGERYWSVRFNRWLIGQALGDMKKAARKAAFFDLLVAA
jgi:hypothetical protein